MKHSISHELISALSALNTHVTYDGPHRTPDDDLVWIPDAEPLVAHSQEHIRVAVGMLVELKIEIDTIRTEIIYKIKDDKVYQRMDRLLRAIDRKL